MALTQTNTVVIYNTQKQVYSTKSSKILDLGVMLNKAINAAVVLCKETSQVVFIDAFVAGTRVAFHRVDSDR